VLVDSFFFMGFCGDSSLWIHFALKE